jgi:hypothetical protein
MVTRPAPGRPKAGATPSGGGPRYSADRGLT